MAETLRAGDLLHEPGLRRGYVVLGVGRGVVLYREYMGAADPGTERIGSELGFETALESGEIKRVKRRVT